MMDIQDAQAKIIEKIRQTEEEWVLRSILRLLDIEDSLEKEEWRQGASSSLNRAYGENEPDYEQLMIKEPNPDYNKRNA
ncbi:MAG: hypothetical protein H6558_16110 [Lewinellaceae bacterium]|nr:hypothetical protein [Lewinellaceae bacterium]MCB9288032.1 hypothetical protein [Lewinellaceae bacterium]